MNSEHASGASTRVDLLAPIRELLSDPARWTKNASARDASGDWIPPADPAATCWCLTGALDKFYPGPPFGAVIGELYRRLDARSSSRKFHGSIPFYNDRSTHAEIVDLLKEPFYGESSPSSEANR